MLPMLKIRLQRVGRKHDPSFRLVLTDSKNGPQSGKFLEVLGSYNARSGKPEVKGERVTYWIGKGAQTSDTVHNLLINEKVIEGKKINVLPKKSPIAKELTEEEKAAVEKAEAPAPAAGAEVPPTGGEAQSETAESTAPAAPETAEEPAEEKESVPTGEKAEAKAEEAVPAEENKEADKEGKKE